MSWREYVALAHLRQALAERVGPEEAERRVPRGVLPKAPEKPAKPKGVYWTRMDRDAPNDRPTCVCDRCGGRFEVQLPQPVGFFGDVLKAFLKAHGCCREKARRT